MVTQTSRRWAVAAWVPSLFAILARTIPTPGPVEAFGVRLAVAGSNVLFMLFI